MIWDTERVAGVLLENDENAGVSGAFAEVFLLGMYYIHLSLSFMAVLLIHP